MTDFGRDELIDARNEKRRLLDGMTTMGRAIEALMEDRVRHMNALRQIAQMTETGIIAQGGGDVHRIAAGALTRPAEPQGELPALGSSITNWDAMGHGATS